MCSEFLTPWKIKRNNGVYRYKLMIFCFYDDIEHFEIWTNILEFVSKLDTSPFTLEANKKRLLDSLLQTFRNPLNKYGTISQWGVGVVVLRK